MRRNRSIRMTAYTIAVLGSVRGLTGCADAEEFRAAASGSLETGLNAIADGLLAGLFAVVEPDAGSDSSSTTSSN